MEEKIIDLYVNQGLVANKIARKLGILTEDVINVLETNHYMAGGCRKRDWVIKAKDAIEYYINNKNASVKNTASLFSIGEDSLSKILRELGYNPKDRLKKDFDESIFDIIDTEEKAYWLGFLFADGYLDSSPLEKDKVSHYIIRMDLGLIDIGHLYKFDQFLGVKKSRVKVYDKKDYKGESKQVPIWTTASKHMWETLNSLGCTPRKSLTLKYPEIKNDLKRHFARGYFDGDGSFGIYGSRGLGELNLSCVGTNDIVDNIFSELNMSIHKYHHEDHAPETMTLNCYSHNAKKLLDYMYKDAVIYLDRKFNKYLEVCRFWEKYQKELQSKNGEGCDANTVLTNQITKG